MPASVKDVAALAGVSASTVSNYLNRPEVVAENSRIRIEEAIAALHFVRNESARQLRAGTSKVVALILLDAWLPFFSELSRGVEEALRPSGWSLFFGNSSRDLQSELDNIEMFRAHQAQGMIIAPEGDVGRRLQQLQTLGIESVQVSPTVDTPALSAVTFDNVRGGELAGMHLTSIGRGRLAFLGDPNKVSNSAARLKGFRNAAAERIDLGQLEVIPCGLTVDDGIRVAEQLARRPPLERPDGIFAANDMVAFGATTALLRAGLRVPEDIAIVGFDDVALARQSVVPLTTIRQPAYDMGRAAAAMLLDLMQSGSRTPRRTMFSAELVVRESTRGGSS